MNESAFKTWMDGYAHAWNTHNPEAVGALFAEDALYFIIPFADPLRGRTAIMDYWKGIARNQKNVRFTYEMLAVTGSIGIAHWQVQFERKRSDRMVHLDGVLTAELDAAHQSTWFREWWHSDNRKT